MKKEIQEIMESEAMLREKLAKKVEELEQLTNDLHVNYQYFIDLWSKHCENDEKIFIALDNGNVLEIEKPNNQPENLKFQVPKNILTVEHKIIK